MIGVGLLKGRFMMEWLFAGSSEVEMYSEILAY
jgi:hypothetical protein